MANVSFAVSGDAMHPKELRTLRLELGITIAELADLLRVDPATVNHWETGSISPSDEEQEHLRSFVEIVTGRPSGTV